MKRSAIAQRAARRQLRQPAAWRPAVAVVCAALVAVVVGPAPAQATIPEPVSSGWQRLQAQHVQGIPRAAWSGYVYGNVWSGSRDALGFPVYTGYFSEQVSSAFADSGGLLLWDVPEVSVIPTDRPFTEVFRWGLVLTPLSDEATFSIGLKGWNQAGSVVEGAGLPGYYSVAGGNYNKWSPDSEVMTLGYQQAGWQVTSGLHVVAQPAETWLGSMMIASEPSTATPGRVNVYIRYEQYNALDQLHEIEGVDNQVYRDVAAGGAWLTTAFQRAGYQVQTWEPDAQGSWRYSTVVTRDVLMRLGLYGAYSFGEANMQAVRTLVESDESRMTATNVVMEGLESLEASSSVPEIPSEDDTATPPGWSVPTDVIAWLSARMPKFDWLLWPLDMADLMFDWGP